MKGMRASHEVIPPSSPFYSRSRTFLAGLMRCVFSKRGKWKHSPQDDQYFFTGPVLAHPAPKCSKRSCFFAATTSHSVFTASDLDARTRAIGIGSWRFGRAHGRWFPAETLRGQGLGGGPSPFPDTPFPLWSWLRLLASSGARRRGPDPRPGSELQRLLPRLGERHTAFSSQRHLQGRRLFLPGHHA